jgi:thymidylate synthase (FAD)
LWKNQHTTPFEAVTLTFEVKAPIFVFRQWHRHRTQSYNELSARYRELPKEFYIPKPEAIGIQSTSNKQGRSTDVDDTMVQRRLVEAHTLRVACERSFQTYHELLAAGWPKELARSILPVNTYSHMFTTMNLLNCLRFLSLRVHSHAQYEVRIYAEAMVTLLKDVVPESVRAWEDFKFVVAEPSKISQS